MRALIAVLAVCLAATGCGGTGEVDPSSDLPHHDSPSVSPLAPTTVSQTPPDAATPAPRSAPTPPRPPAVTEEPWFTATYRGVDSGGAAVIGGDAQHLVVVSGRKVIGTDRSGRTRWTVSLPRVPRESTSESDAWVVGDSVLVSYGIKGQYWPGLVMIRVFDVATGEERWRDDSASFASVWGDDVYLSVCIGKQENHIGDCTLSSRDVATGATHWSVATYASAQVEALEDGRILEHAYPTGSPGAYRVRDAATGAPLGDWRHVDDVGDSYLTDAAWITTGRPDRNPEDGCRETVTAYSFAGEELWHRRMRLPKDRNGSDVDCYTSYVTPGDDGLLTLSWYKGAPQVVDATTGKTLWTGRRGEELPVVTRSLVVAAEEHNGFVAGVRAIAPGTGKALWGDPVRSEGDWILDGRELIGYDEGCYDVCRTSVVNPTTGKVLATYKGAYVARGDDWLATTTEIDTGLGRYRVYGYRRR